MLVEVVIVMMTTKKEEVAFAGAGIGIIHGEQEINVVGNINNNELL